MESNDGVGQSLLPARLFQTALLLSIPAYVFIHLRLAAIGQKPRFESDDPMLSLLTLALAISSVTLLATAAYVPRALAASRRKDSFRKSAWITTLILKATVALHTPWELRRVRPYSQRVAEFLGIVVMRGCVLEAIAVYGFILGMMGGRWQIVSLFFMAAAAGLILTFPTEKSLKRILKSEF